MELKNMLYSPPFFIPSLFHKMYFHELLDIASTFLMQ